MARAGACVNVAFIARRRDTGKACGINQALQEARRQAFSASLLPCQGKDWISATTFKGAKRRHKPSPSQKDFTFRAIQEARQITKLRRAGDRFGQWQGIRGAQECHRHRAGFQQAPAAGRNFHRAPFAPRISAAKIKNNRAAMLGNTAPGAAMRAAIALRQGLRLSKRHRFRKGAARKRRAAFFVIAQRHPSAEIL